MTSWFRTLKHCDIDDAKAATDLLGTDAEPEPKGWDRHPLAIAGICRGIRHETRTSGTTAATPDRLMATTLTSVPLAAIAARSCGTL